MITMSGARASSAATAMRRSSNSSVCSTQPRLSGGPSATARGERAPRWSRCRCASGPSRTLDGKGRQAGRVLGFPVLPERHQIEVIRANRRGLRLLGSQDAIDAVDPGDFIVPGGEVPDAGLVDEPEWVERAADRVAAGAAIADLEPPVVPDRPGHGPEVAVITGALVRPAAGIEVKALPRRASRSRAAPSALRRGA